jgi:hypothetical protein
LVGGEQRPHWSDALQLLHALGASLGQRVRHLQRGGVEARYRRSGAVTVIPTFEFGLLLLTMVPCVISRPCRCGRIRTTPMAPTLSSAERSSPWWECPTRIMSPNTSSSLSVSSLSQQRSSRSLLVC